MISAFMVRERGDQEVGNPHTILISWTAMERMGDKATSLSRMLSKALENMGVAVISASS